MSQHEEATPAAPVEEGAVIARGTAAVLSAAFIALIVFPPLHQLACGGKEIGQFARLIHTVPSPRSLRAFETTLANNSLLAGKMRRAYRSLAYRALRQGSDSVLVGEDGFLFYRQDVEFCALPPRDGGAAPSTFNAASASIRDYHHQLRARGIHLVVAPLPVAPVLYPEKVWPGYPVEKGPAWNMAMSAWIASLHAQGVDVIDLAPALWRARQAGAPVFVRHDTHWSPEGVKAASEVLAQHLRPLLASTQPRRCRSVAQSARLPGDLLSMLGLPGDWRGNPPEWHELHRVMDGPRPAAAGDDAPVLLLGDSFSMVHDSAGLASRLMSDLGTGVQVLAEPGGAVHRVREMLRQHPETLAHKQVVIWAFASRHLHEAYRTTWQRVELPPASASRTPCPSCH